jgi:hypothetical protein
MYLVRREPGVKITEFQRLLADIVLPVLVEIMAERRALTEGKGRDDLCKLFLPAARTRYGHIHRSHPHRLSGVDQDTHLVHALPGHLGGYGHRGTVEPEGLEGPPRLFGYLSFETPEPSLIDDPIPHKPCRHGQSDTDIFQLLALHPFDGNPDLALGQEERRHKKEHAKSDERHGEGQAPAGPSRALRSMEEENGGHDTYRNTPTVALSSGRDR